MCVWLRLCSLSYELCWVGSVACVCAITRVLGMWWPEARWYESSGCIELSLCGMLFSIVM